MGLTMKQRHAVIAELSRRYRRGSKLERSAILDDVVDLAEYNRAYAALLLRRFADQTVYCRGGILLKPTVKRKRKRAPVYGPPVHRALRKIWAIYDCPCGKYLAPSLPEIVRVLEREGEIDLEPEVRRKLLEISPATIDRILAHDKRGLQIRGRTHTTPGSILKRDIPIRTFGDWDVSQPGYLEIDLVGHEGGNARGDFSVTLTVTDISSAWTEVRILTNKAQKWVFQALLDIRSKLPFPVLGIDCDNGSEFINDHLLRYCTAEGIEFTRARPGKKNDNCYVEQKNNMVVRRAVGYLRYDTDQARAIVSRIYEPLNLSVNFFRPVRKLVSKTRIGAKQTRRYDTPKTPCMRVIDCPATPDDTRECLSAQYESLNPAGLKREITRLQQQLWRAASPSFQEESA